MRRALQYVLLGITFVDVVRTHLYASTDRDIYVRLPAEDQHEGEEYTCGKLKKAMYSTGDAARDWQRKCSEIVCELGFLIGKVSPCHLSDKGWHVCGLLHGDVLAFVGEGAFLKVFADNEARKLKVKICHDGNRSSRCTKCTAQEHSSDNRGSDIRERSQTGRSADRDLQLGTRKVVVTRRMREFRKARKGDVGYERENGFSEWTSPLANAGWAGGREHEEE